MKETFLLSGIKVLELANVLAGPSVGATLAELGACVIKIENLRTQGDVTRSWKLPDESCKTDISAYFSSVNWGKKSVSIDLQSPEGIAIIHEAIPYFDIVITSYKPGDAEKLKMDYVTFQKIKPSIIFVHLTGYGPENNRAGYDAIIQAEAGFTYMNGKAGSEPIKMPVALMDLLAGHQMKEAIFLALYKRERTGQGQYIHVSLLQSGITALANQATNWLVGNYIPQAMGSDHPNIAPYGTIYYTKDQKPIVLAIGNDRQFHDLCNILGQPELSSNEKYKNNINRVRNRQDLHLILCDLISKFTRVLLLDSFLEKKIPSGGVNNMQEVFEQPEAQPLIMEAISSDGMKLKGVRSLAFTTKDSTFAKQLSAPPHYGQHTAIVLKEVLQFSNEKIQSLIEKNVIYDKYQ